MSKTTYKNSGTEILINSRNLKIMMRIISQKSREYGEKSYFKHLIVLPSKILEKLGWKAGDKLIATTKRDKLVVKKEQHDK